MKIKRVAYLICIAVAAIAGAQLHAGIYDEAVEINVIVALTGKKIPVRITKNMTMQELKQKLVNDLQRTNRKDFRHVKTLDLTIRYKNSGKIIKSEKLFAIAKEAAEGQVSFVVDAAGPHRGHDHSFMEKP